MNLSHCLDPLTDEHKRRLVDLAQSLPGKVHAPWKAETPTELRERLATEQRIRTRGMPKL